jgi:hypothetical protein
MSYEESCVFGILELARRANGKRPGLLEHQWRMAGRKRAMLLRRQSDQESVDLFQRK